MAQVFVLPHSFRAACGEIGYPSVLADSGSVSVPVRSHVGPGGIAEGHTIPLHLPTTTVNNLVCGGFDLFASDDQKVVVVPMMHIVTHFVDFADFLDYLGGFPDGTILVELSASNQVRITMPSRDMASTFKLSMHRDSTLQTMTFSVTADLDHAIAVLEEAGMRVRVYSNMIWWRPKTDAQVVIGALST